jgi:hypothetical protein
MRTKNKLNQKENEIFKKLMENKEEILKNKENKSKKDMTNFYQIYSKMQANRDQNKKIGSGVNPEFWKEIAKNRKEKEMEEKK